MNCVKNKAKIHYAAVGACLSADRFLSNRKNEGSQATAPGPAAHLFKNLPFSNLSITSSFRFRLIGI